MGGFWKFIGSKGNRARLGWLGGGAVVVIAGLWTAFIYFFPHKIDPGGGVTEISATIRASCGSVAINGPVSGATITAGGPTNSDCAAKSK
jgi:hypothetical protein